MSNLKSSSATNFTIFDDEPLAPRTTLKVGGNARRLIELYSEAAALSTIRDLRQRQLPFVILGEGSNIVVSDEGIDETVLCLKTNAISWDPPQNGMVRVTCDAGVHWDRFVEESVVRHLSGIECLSGIPGTVGATPIQNVGAYGQEVCETVDHVRVYDRKTDEVSQFLLDACGFQYRHSVFKAEPHRYVVLAVTFQLRVASPQMPRYEELARELSQTTSLTVAEIRHAVLTLRRAKSMVVDPNDPFSRSAGSFFLNPIVTRAHRIELENRIGQSPPSHPVDNERVKLSAAWLIERAGFQRGFRRGRVGLSPHHALAIMNYGNGTARDVVALARDIQATVLTKFNVVLDVEPRFLGFK